MAAESDSNLIRVYNCIYLLSSLSQFPPIMLQLTDSTKQVFPIVFMSLLESEETLLKQLPINIMCHFISFFQSTCTSPQREECAKDFAQKLINLMTKIPQTSAQYHHYFIHEFFFPIINSYNGVAASFIWTQSNRVISKVTQALETYPIRKNDSIAIINRRYYRLANTKDLFQHLLDNPSVHAILAKKGSQ